MPDEENEARAQLTQLEAKLVTLDSNWISEREVLLEKYQIVSKGKPKLERGMRLASLGLIMLVATAILYFLADVLFWFLIPIGILVLFVGYWEFSSASRFEGAFKVYEDERQITADSLSRLQTQLGITPKWSKRARADRAKKTF